MRPKAKIELERNRIEGFANGSFAAMRPRWLSQMPSMRRLVGQGTTAQRAANRSIRPRPAFQGLPRSLGGVLLITRRTRCLTKRGGKHPMTIGARKPSCDRGYNQKFNS